MPNNSSHRCNRTMSIGDDDTMMRCQLPMGHDGPHEESYESETYGKVTTTFEKGTTPVQMERLKHMIPAGETCQFEDGRKCQFLAIQDQLEGENPKLACYLSGGIFTRIQPSEYCKGYACYLSRGLFRRRNWPSYRPSE